MRYTQLMIITLVLAACGAQQSVPITERSINVDTEVREPARAEAAGLQIKPMQTPGVAELLADATQAEQAGDLQQATILLERAMRLQPGNPEVLQRLAEVKLADAQFEQALNYAARSYDQGPKLGELCSRNWHTIAFARENLEDQSGALQARQRAADCVQQPAARF